MAKLAKLKEKPFPKAPPLIKLIGPSFILLGLGLGSGEVILWPFLASNFGMGIIWGAIVGLTFQFFINMEIERYTLARGESIFVGFTRKLKALPFWFILSTFIPWIWPGIAAVSAALFVHVFGLSEGSGRWLAIAFLIAMGAILSLGPVLYKTLERFQKTVIFIGVPSIFVISVIVAEKTDFSLVANGLIGNGDGFWFLPLGAAGFTVATFLAALAYAGAGGNLNLAQSFYVKEKGYGMGKYSRKITSLVTGKKSKSKDSYLTGATFKTTPANVAEFNKWWKRVNIEHFLVFWVTGAITIILLALLAYNLTFGQSSTSDISFVITEGIEIGKQFVPWLGTFFLIVVGITLFGTQLTVFDASSRILSENLILASRQRIKEKYVPNLYYLTLWILILSGIAILYFTDAKPLQLVLISAILNAIAMFVHSGLTLWLNSTVLPKQIAPNMFRKTMMMAAFLFYGAFSIFVVANEIVTKILHWDPLL